MATPCLALATLLEFIGISIKTQFSRSLKLPCVTLTVIFAVMALMPRTTPLNSWDGGMIN